MDGKSIAKTIKVLVVEADSSRTALLKESLQGLGTGQFEPVWVGRLDKALPLLRSEPLKPTSFDAILLDLALPDSQGLDTFLQVYSQVSEVPILTLSSREQPALAMEVIREGAQDCLFVEELEPSQLCRALLYAIERHRTWVMLHQLCLTDDLTGLLNRRGFLSLAQHQMKIAKREKWKMLVLFADLDGLKKINDSFGHPQGDQALRTVADLLRETFRTTDLVARLGGDEFVVLANNVSAAGIQAIEGRLQKSIDRHNARLQDYQLSLSWGLTHFDPARQRSIEDAILTADQALYEHKREKQKILSG